MPRIKLEPFENVQNGRVAICTTDSIWPNTLEQILVAITPIAAGAIAKANIANLKVIFGTKTVWDLSGAQLQTLNDFAGMTSTTTLLSLQFANRRARDIAQQYIGAPDFSALNVRKVQLQLDIDGATDPFQIQAWADVVRPGLLTAAGNQMFRQLFRTPLTPSAAVQDQPQQINYGQGKGALLRQLHFYSNLVARLKIKRDGLDYFEDVTADLNNAALKEARWVPQTNVYSFVADEDDNQTKSLTSIRQDGAGGSLVPQQILMTTSGPGAFDAIADVYAGLDG